ncbi:MAG: potassium channel protein [Planctomycetaceae bacterium]|nr:potassium channel protein [Planctomycetaceae bacterium]
MRRLLQIPLLIISMLLAGAIGLHLLTGQPMLDCFYNSVILLTTVGSREPEPMTNTTKLFIIAYLACGLGVFMYSLTQFGQMLFNADLRKLLERRRMESDISKLSRHFIVCGMGRMGETLCEYLESRRQPFVVVDESAAVFDEEFQRRKWMYICGDASDDDVLNRAGIRNARALTTVLGTDADNLYVVLSARLLCPSLQIVARASDERAAQKMTQAGATRVMNPLSSGAIRMARFMLSPSIENFVEVAETQGVDWEIADVHVPENSTLVGRRISESGLRDFGIMLLGVRKPSGRKLFPPPSDLVIEADDNLFAFGNSEGVARLSQLLETMK